MKKLIIIILMMISLNSAALGTDPRETENLYEYSYRQLEECNLLREYQIDSCVTILQDEEKDYSIRYMYLLVGLTICAIVLGLVLVIF